MRRFMMAIGMVFLLSVQAWAAATLENPSPGALKSGVGVISGWVCDAEELEVSFDGGSRTFVPYGSERVDTEPVCGDADNGFGLLWNYNELGDGPHTATLYADGMIQTQVNFNVTTLGTNFLRGVTGQGSITLSDGKQVNVQWEEATQGFTITGYELPPVTPPPTTGDSEEQRLRGLLGEWDFTLDFSLSDPGQRPITRPYEVLRVQRDSEGWWTAGGLDPLDNSAFVIGVFSVVLAGQEYQLGMIDIDTVESGTFCSTYFFNQSGNRLEGYFIWNGHRGQGIEGCDGDDIITRGTFTGRR